MLVLLIRIWSDLELCPGSGSGIVVPDPARIKKQINLNFINFRPEGLKCEIENGKMVVDRFFLCIDFNG